MSRVTVVARLTARQGMEERVREELLGLVEETHKEPGCINYDLHVSSDNPCLFLFYENWHSKAALDEHFETKHIQHLKSISPQLLEEEADVQLFEMISKPKAIPAR